METTGATNSNLTLQMKQIRLRVVELISRACASHVGSCLSMVELLSAVYQSVDLDKIRRRADDRDRVIVSKGHSAAAIYTIMARYGLMDKDTLSTYGMNGSLLSGHVSHFVPLVEHSTGALGHGASVGVGIAVGLRASGFGLAKCYVIAGDGELNEGSNWEAFMLAGHLKLNNLCVIVDNNCLGGVCNTEITCSLSPLKAKFESFGFNAIELDGHDLPAILKAIAEFKGGLGPMVIIAHTVKGKGASFMEGQNVWHYRPPKNDDCEKMKKELFGDECI